MMRVNVSKVSILSLLVVLCPLAGCAEEEESGSLACELYRRSAPFKYSDDVWLQPRDTSDSRVDLAAANLLGTRIMVAGDDPWGVEMPHVPPEHNFHIVSLKFTGISTHFMIMNYEQAVGTSVDLIAAVHGGQRHPEIAEFSEQRFADWLIWYHEHGQGSYACTEASAVRDAKKYFVESLLHPAVEPTDPSSAAIGEYGFHYEESDGLHSLYLSDTRWLIKVTIAPSDDIPDIREGQTRTADVLAAIEEYVADTGDLQRLSVALESLGVSFVYAPENSGSVPAETE